MVVILKLCLIMAFSLFLGFGFWYGIIILFTGIFNPIEWTFWQKCLFLIGGFLASTGNLQEFYKKL